MTALAEKLDACPSCRESKPWAYDAQSCTACGYGLFADEHPDMTAWLSDIPAKDAYSWRLAMHYAHRFRHPLPGAAHDPIVYGDPHAEHRTHGGRL